MNETRQVAEYIVTINKVADDFEASAVATDAPKHEAEFGFGETALDAAIDALAAVIPE